MIIDNVLVYTEDKEFVKGGIVLENDTIKSVYKDSEKIKVDNNEIILNINDELHKHYPRIF